MPVSYEENLKMAEAIAVKVKEANGNAYFVGGFVRDRLMGKAGKDIDIEVHRVTPETLYEILKTVGNPTTMGSSFGVFGLEHYELDIAMPRKETATGRGHRDFNIDVDPYLGTERAAKRRDFTVNALMQDILTGEVLDHFGGMKDLENGVLRHVNDASFAEDPLRVLRAAQFAARLKFKVAYETVQQCKGMNLENLARERVWAELEKALIKAEKPSVFFRVLREMQQMDIWFPEVRSLIDIQQNPEFHPEGDVWNHTMLVLDRAALLRSESRYMLIFMLAALCHDFGKTVTTEILDGRICSREHEKAGLPLAQSFLARLTNEANVIKMVLNHIELHMLPNQLAYQQSGQKALMRLLDRSECPEDLLLLAEADRGICVSEEKVHQADIYLHEGLNTYYRLMEEPSVTGKDLIAAGYKPGPVFGKALKYAHQLHLSGVCKKEALAQTLAYLKKETI